METKNMKLSGTAAASIKVLFFLLTLLLWIFPHRISAQTWSENFNSSTDFADYEGYSFSSTCAGTNCYTIGTSPRLVSGWGNSLQIPASGNNLYSYTFTTGYVYLTGTSSITFDWNQHNNSHAVEYDVNIIDTSGNSTNIVTNGDKGNGNSGTVTTNFVQTGWYRVEFVFIKTSGGNNNSHFVVDNFTSNISDFSPFLADIDLGCGMEVLESTTSAIDTVVNSIIVSNNGPNTIFAGKTAEISVELPSLLSFDSIDLPPNTRFEISAGNPQLAIWYIDSLSTGSEITLTIRSLHDNTISGLPVTVFSDYFSSPDGFHDPNIANDEASCFITLLPVSLSEFSARVEEDRAHLHFTTVAEINNMGFRIYSSSDAQEWKYLGFVEGVGNSYQINTYTFADPDPLSAVRFYKLVQVDFDGTATEAGRTSVHVPFDPNSFVIFPNPTSENIQIEFSDDVAGAEIEVLNAVGQTVSTTKSTSYSVSVFLPQAKGIYYVRVKLRDKVVTRKVVKN